MGVQNHDIKTVAKLIGSAPVDLGMGAVASGMRRYFTFVRVDNVWGGTQKVYLASATATTYASTPTKASASQKLALNIEANGHEQIPNGVPDTEHPLFVLAETLYLDAITDRGSAYLFLQYYDK